MGKLDPFSAEKRSEVMRSVGQKDTAPEVKLRRALWHAGFRYHKHREIAGATPDIAFIGPKVAVFVDGCFWHGCPDHYSAPENNREFWCEKLQKNRARDLRNDRDLQEANWTVLRFWECEVNNKLMRVVDDICKELSGL